MGAGERSEAYCKRPAACARIPRAYTQPSSTPAHKPGNPASSRPDPERQDGTGRAAEAVPCRERGHLFRQRGWDACGLSIFTACRSSWPKLTSVSRSSMLIGRRLEGSPRPRRAQISAAIYQAAAASSRSAATDTRSSASYAKSTLRSAPWASHTSSCPRPTASGVSVALRRHRCPVENCPAGSAAASVRILSGGRRRDATPHP